MKINSVKIFLISYAIYFTGMVVDVTSFPQADLVRKACMMISLVGFVLCMIHNHQNNPSAKTQSIVKVLILGLFLAFALISRDFLIFMLVIMGLASKDLPYEFIEKVFLISTIIMIAVSLAAVAACYLEIIPNINTPRYAYSLPRYAWGFSHSQVLSLLFFYIVIYYHCYRERVRVWEALIALVIMVILSQIFDARNALLSLLAFYVLVFCYKCVSKIHGFPHARAVTVLAKITPIIMTGISFLILALYKVNNSFAIWINRVLSNRFWTAKENFSAIPIQFLKFVSYKEYEQTLVTTVDNGYFYVVLRYGLFYLLVLFLLFILITNYFSKGNKIVSCLALIAIAVSIFISNTLAGCYFIPFWLIAMKSVVEEKSWIKEKIEFIRKQI